MFRLYDDFKVIDDNMQPYSLEVERHTAIENLHTKVENEEFGFNSIGNRFIFTTPALSEFQMIMHFGFTSMYEFNPNFTLLFHYDKKARQGEGIRFVYDLEHKVEVSYVLIDKMKVIPVETVILEDVVMEEDLRYEFTAVLEGDQLKGSVAGKSYTFNVKKGTGYLAIERKNYIGQWLISDFEILSNDAMTETIVQPEVTVQIPLLNGGDIPYVLTWSIKKINERFYLDYALDGGTATRKLNREDRPGQYAVERDQFINPYVKLRKGNQEEKYYLFRDTTVIADPNIYWDCLKLYWNCPKLPVTRKYLIPSKLLDEDMTVTFGYEKFIATGYNMQAGAAEFIYDIKGNMLYGGPVLEDNIYELKSPADKKAVRLIPQDCYNREEVVAHLENNHYFSVNENIHFMFQMRTKLKAEYVKIRAEIRDIYDREIISSYCPELHLREWKFGYKEICCKVTHEPLEEKLYRIVFLVQYGDSQIDTYERVFEVFDKDSKVSPAVASGLPYVFSMPNEQKWLSRNSFDLWNPMPSCDVEHYISAVTDTPIEAERKRVWEMIKPFKREWFAWLASRTCKDWEMEKHLDIVKNCDYLYYPSPISLYPMRNDFYRIKSYTYSPKMMDIMREFLQIHPQFAKKLTFPLPDTSGQERIYTSVDETGKDNGKINFTNEHLKEFMDVCHEEWIDFALEKIHESIREQNYQMKSINPDFKRSAYGPFNQYVNATLSYHTIRSYGMIPDNRLAEDIYTGFTIYEDYPYSCGYQTYRGAFGVMTTLLHVPKLTMYPEQYKGSNLGGCIDGAVKFSHAPMGSNIMEPYQNSTHAFEFVFNTPRRISGGYRYWDTYGFHRPDYSAEWWNVLAKDWKYVLDYKPARPLKTLGFVAEYTDAEDILDVEIETLVKDASLKNRSEDSHGFLYDCSRESGLNAGFAVKFETLKELSSSECDILFLPTLQNVEDDVIAQIRRLYREGTSLVAVSDITGLEDIFGVEPYRKKVMVDTLEWEGETEYIYPMETEAYYQATDAKALITANGEAAVLRKNNAVLFNMPVMDLGYECFEGTQGKGKNNVSPLLKKGVINILRELAKPDVMGENVGTTLFETQKGEVVLMAIDYSPFDNRKRESHTAVVTVNVKNIKDVSSDREILQVKDENEKVREIRFNILPHETVFMILKKSDSC